MKRGCCRRACCRCRRGCCCRSFRWGRSPRGRRPARAPGGGRCAITTDYVESGFAHLDLATRTLCKAGIDACIGVAHADILGAFHPDGTRRAAARAAVMRERRSTGASSGAAVDEEEVDAKVEEFRVTSFFCLPKEERWRIIKSLQKGYQDDIVKANRGALKAEASARLERLQFKKDEHIRLCNVRCGKYNDYVKIEPCRSLVALAALRAQHGTDLKACAEALRDQIRVRVHVFKIKAADIPNTGSDSSEAAVQRLVIELRAVVVGALPRSPPPPVPYPTRAVHRAPTAEAAAFHIKHLRRHQRRPCGGGGGHGGRGGRWGFISRGQFTAGG